MSKLFSFVFSEAIKNAVGFFVGLSSSYFVQLFFVKRGIGNLWGLASKREAVSKDNYEWIMYLSSYIIGLLAMSLVNSLFKKAKTSE